jgi:hypothetical protein
MTRRYRVCHYLMLYPTMTGAFRGSHLIFIERGEIRALLLLWQADLDLHEGFTALEAGRIAAILSTR